MRRTNSWVLGANVIVNGSGSCPPPNSGRALNRKADVIGQIEAGP
jgi:hypothetical protein